ncbi:unnamed protein product [Periconia digitata]|uniref:Vacuolar-sorting protein SNF7 n=1 Tax=Periconia digitata TaxID=1303443 RepID=A0A9W4U1I2_9PLEO|nr:unnamed protein product [Periconia digitata]
MSGWGLGWFGGGQAKKDAPKKAILQLRQQLELLNKREKHLHNQMEEQDTLARKYVTTNKTRKFAKTALRKKKNFETAATNTSAQIMTLEEEIHSIETANINKETLDAMKNASTAMKHIHQGMTVDTVETVMEDIREQHEIGQEINNALIAPQAVVDDEELDEELAELQQEQLDEQMIKGGSVPVSDAVSLPTAPRSEVVGNRPGKAAPVEEDDEEAELRKLQAEMAI